MMNSILGLTTEKRLGIERRFWPKVEKTGGCWTWRGSITTGGYGSFSINFGPRDNEMAPAHRVAYELVKGRIPEGLTIDHLCRNPSCVNPNHLEPVSMRENTLRGYGPTAKEAKQTHCKYGHPLSGQNLITETINGKTGRKCRECKNRRLRELRARKALALLTKPADGEDA